MSLTACQTPGADDAAPPSSAGSASGTRTPAQGSSSSGQATTSTGGTRVRITFDGHTVTGTLGTNPVARDLAGQLPLTLHFSDLMSQEKIGRLPSKLTTDGVPRGDDPQVGEIGYWTPDGNLVFYYGDVGYWDGIVRIGRFDPGTNLGQIQQMDDNTTVRVEAVS